MGKAKTPVPDAPVLGDLASAAARAARSHLAAAEYLLEGKFWPQARALAVLAVEEAGKAFLCTTAMLAPEEMRQLFPFGDLDRDHVGKLSVGHSIRAQLAFFKGGDTAPSTMTEAVAELEDLAREDNRGKQLGLYADYRDGAIWEPSHVSEEQAKMTVAAARDVLDNGGPVIDAMVVGLTTDNVPPAVQEFLRRMLQVRDEGEDAIKAAIQDELAKIDGLAEILQNAPEGWLTAAFESVLQPTTQEPRRDRWPDGAGPEP